MACCLSQTPTAAPLPLHSWHSAHLQRQPPLSPPPCPLERRPALPSAAKPQGRAGVEAFQLQGSLLLFWRHYHTRTMATCRKPKVKAYPVTTTWVDKQEVDWVRLDIPALLLT